MKFSNINESFLPEQPYNPDKAGSLNVLDEYCTDTNVLLSFKLRQLISFIIHKYILAPVRKSLSIDNGITLKCTLPQTFSTIYVLHGFLKIIAMGKAPTKHIYYCSGLLR